MTSSFIAVATTELARSADLLPALTFLAKVTLLLCGALAISALLRRASAGARHLIWLGTLVAMLLLPVLSRWAPLKLEVLPTSWATRTSDPQVRGDAHEPESAAMTAIVARASTGAGAEERGVDRAQPTHDSFASSATIDRATTSLPAYSVWLLLFAAWALIAIALIVWIAAGAVSVARIVSGARPLVGHRWDVALCEVADRLDLSETPRLLASEHVEMPFACGVLHPTIVLPATAESWSEDRRRAVLFHELAHVRRRDLVGHTLGRIACALYWFHPLVWTAAKRLRAESERACDDLVLSCGARASEYADHLLDMVTSVRRHAAPAMALPMARRREFEGRMLAILDPQVRRVGPGRLQTSMLILSLSALSLCVAAIAPSPSRVLRNETPQSPAMTAASTTESPSASRQSISSVASSAAPAAPNGPAPVDGPAAIQLGSVQPQEDAARAPLAGRPAVIRERYKPLQSRANRDSPTSAARRSRRVGAQGSGLGARARRE